MTQEQLTAVLVIALQRLGGSLELRQTDFAVQWGWLTVAVEEDAAGSKIVIAVERNPESGN